MVPGRPTEGKSPCSTTYSWTYFGPHGEQMVQATAGNTDTPVGLFTNGG